MAIQPDLVGTITLTAGSTAFTWAGTSLAAADIRPGDEIRLPAKGLVLTIGGTKNDITATGGLLTDNCPAAAAGAAQTARLRYQPDLARTAAQTRELISRWGDDADMLRQIGMGTKDTSEAPDFSGIPIVNNLLSPGMVAGGAAVDFGIGPAGMWYRAESGLQICASIILMSWAGAGRLQYQWYYPREFAVSPMISVTPFGAGAVNMPVGPKRTGSVVDHTTPFLDNCTIRMMSDGLYTVGDEAFSASVIAVGFWKEPPVQQIQTLATQDGWWANYLSGL